MHRLFPITNLAVNSRVASWPNIASFSTAKGSNGSNAKNDSTSKKLYGGFLKTVQTILQLQINSYQVICAQAREAFNIDRTDLGLTVSPTMHAGTSVRQILQPVQGGGVLPDSIQETFQELRSRRLRIMELLGSIENLKTTNQNLTQQYKQVAEEKNSALSTRQKIRDSFQGMDQQFIDLRNDVINLREVESKYKDLITKHRELQGNYERVMKGSRPEQSIENCRLKAKLESREQEIQRLDKRIDRLRNQSPCMVSLQNVFAAIGKASTSESFHHDALNEQFAAVQRKYADILTETFPSQSTVIGARGLIAKACAEYIRSSFFYAAFDCVVECASGIDKQLLKYIQGQADNGFEILRHSNTSVEIACPSKTSAVGPYGVLSCFCLAFPEKGANLSVYPTLARKTLEKREKVSIVHETCRSSKPGGQAANVTETQVKSALSFEGKVIARSTCQDTRSQHENKKRSEQRLIDESLQHDLAKLKTSPPALQPINLSQADVAGIQHLFESCDFETDLYIHSALRMPPS